ncbi:hypothetical protein EVAR_45702_1 [Eumeta japonica]|uniref:Uncharacterized protein n=1 Tax=Eumeta variegata TaxID=151549 RepID=A0A4C1WWX2_EUMVA|nr:hypothetical protein EVAR_45702_1 [Eumeta japonica]
MDSVIYDSEQRRLLTNVFKRARCDSKLVFAFCCASRDRLSDRRPATGGGRRAAGAGPGPLGGGSPHARVRRRKLYYHTRIFMRARTRRDDGSHAAYSDRRPVPSYEVAIRG